MAFKVKPIKPRATKETLKAVERAVKAGLERAAQEAIELLEETTRTWDNQPEFEAVPVKDGIVVGTDSEIFEYVDQGTKPHAILPKRAGGMLRFRTGYIAKTQPNQLSSWGGGASGEAIIRPRVWHPGTKPRNFIKLVDKAMQKRVKELIEEELDGAI